ncbi:MAG: energy transducer TonB [Pseudodesulfovibrio sp.]|nr:energy transducer TonB [Pseudodesulfovibrio sp.]
MIHKAHRVEEYTTSVILAAAAVGLISIGIIFLADAHKPDHVETIEGAIRLAMPKPKPPEKQRKRLEEKIKPPEMLPKKKSAPKKTKEIKPVMDLHVPSFSANVHPALTSGMVLPAGALGGIGFNLDEVDESPQVLRDVPPEYPFGAKRNHIEGQIVIRMLVTKDGTPTKFSIHSADPTGIFEKTSLAAAKRWRFKPGRYAGKDVDTWVLLPFNFKMTQ